MSLTGRLVSQAAAMHLARRMQSTALARPAAAAVKWNTELDRTGPDYTTPMDRKTLDAKIEFYSNMRDPREEIKPVTVLQLKVKGDPVVGSLWDNWGTWHSPKERTASWPEDWKEFPERDTKHFPQPVLTDFGPKTRMGFIPDSWFNFFYEKTGVTGPYLFFFGGLTFLMQKEMLVWDHNFKKLFMYILILPPLAAIANRALASKLDNQTTNTFNVHNNALKEIVGALRDGIATNDQLRQFYQIVNQLLFKAKAENVAMQLESEYRNRLTTVHSEIKKRLDFMVEIDSSRRRFEHKHMTDWIVGEVKKSITPDLEKAIMNKCLADLKLLVAKV